MLLKQVVKRECVHERNLAEFSDLINDYASRIVDHRPSYEYWGMEIEVDDGKVEISSGEVGAVVSKDKVILGLLEGESHLPANRSVIEDALRIAGYEPLDEDAPTYGEVLDELGISNDIYREGSEE